MNILLIGPQGSGKGTQARLLIEKYSFVSVSIGDLLRNAASKYPEIKEAQDKGVLVPDTLTFKVLTEYLTSQDVTKDILFDGYPRTVEQYQMFTPWLRERQQKLDLVVVLEISEQETVRRLSARRQDPKTGKIYNLITEPPGPEIDVATLVQRDDDKPEAIMERLAVYNSLTVPLISELKKETKVVEMNGERPIETIQADIVKEINLLKK